MIIEKLYQFLYYPQGLARLREIYLADAPKYALDKQVDKLEQMFIDAYNEQKEGKDLHSAKPRKKDKRLLKRVHKAATDQKKHPEKLKKYFEKK